MPLSHRPVWIACPTATEKDFHFRNHRILCVLGLDSREIALVQCAEDIASRAAADLVLLHVVPESTEALLHQATDGGARPLSKESAAKQLDRLARSLGASSTTSVMVGNPNQCVGVAAVEHAVDLVLVSRASGGSEAVYGDDLSEILWKLHCPLLTNCG